MSRLLRTAIEQEYCELEVLLFDFTRIYEHCEVNYQVVNKVQPPLVFNLDNNRIFIFNNGLLDWNMAYRGGLGASNGCAKQAAVGP